MWCVFSQCASYQFITSQHQMQYFFTAEFLHVFIMPLFIVNLQERSIL